jgi:hypothetical protein
VEQSGHCRSVKSHAQSGQPHLACATKIVTASARQYRGANVISRDLNAAFFQSLNPALNGGDEIINLGAVEI